MSGRDSIHSHCQRIEAAFTRVDNNFPHDAELRADYAKYLCVLVSGFVEKALSEIVLEHARRVGAPTLLRFVEQNTSKFTNANSQKVAQLLGSFDQDWKTAIDKIIVDKYKDALDSIISLRHQIAHGRSVEVTYVRIKDYFKSVAEVIERIQDLCIPDKKNR